jgi:hypothetical protein
MDDFESARSKFLPNNIKILFVAEAPPALDSRRFFYFVPVTLGDDEGPIPARICQRG